MSDLRQQFKDAVHQFVSCLERKDVDSLVALYAETGANHVPFNAVFGAQQDFSGEELRGWKDVWPMFEEWNIRVHSIYVDDVERSAIFTMDAHYRWKDSYNEWTKKDFYDNSYVMIVHFDDEGKILDFYEYPNMIIAGISFGMVDVTPRDGVTEILL